jgi:voltage-gated sodium channel
MALALLDEEHAEPLERVDVACLWFFAAELLFRVYRARLGFFRSPWCCFDAAIIVLALAPVAGGGIAVLRLARLRGGRGGRKEPEGGARGGQVAE